VIADRTPHAGIVWLPADWSIREDAPAVVCARGVLHSFIRRGTRGAHGIVIQPQSDGIHTIADGHDQLLMSMEELAYVIDDRHKVPRVADQCFICEPQTPVQ
jgi:hypothetical protein